MWVWFLRGGGSQSHSALYTLLARAPVNSLQAPIGTRLTYLTFKVRYLHRVTLFSSLSNRRFAAAALATGAHIKHDSFGVGKVGNIDSFDLPRYLEFLPQAISNSHSDTLDRACFAVRRCAHEN